MPQLVSYFWRKHQLHVTPKVENRYKGLETTDPDGNAFEAPLNQVE